MMHNRPAPTIDSNPLTWVRVTEVLLYMNDLYYYYKESEQTD